MFLIESSDADECFGPGKGGDIGPSLMMGILEEYRWGEDSGV